MALGSCSAGRVAVAGRRAWSTWPLTLRVPSAERESSWRPLRGCRMGAGGDMGAWGDSVKTWCLNWLDRRGGAGQAWAGGGRAREMSQGDKAFCEERAGGGELEGPGEGWAMGMREWGEGGRRWCWRGGQGPPRGATCHLCSEGSAETLKRFKSRRVIGLFFKR